MQYTIKPDAPGHVDCSLKVFHDGVKVATLTQEQVQEALQQNRNEKEYIASLRSVLSETMHYVPTDTPSGAVLREDAERLLNGKEAISFIVDPPSEVFARLLNAAKTLSDKFMTNKPCSTGEYKELWEAVQQARNQ